MLQPNKARICLVGDALSGGGAERVHAFLSDFFTANGIEVHNVIVQDRVGYGFSGRLLNMGKLKGRGPFNRLKRFWVLRRYIRQHRFDYIIDFRMRKKPLQDLLIAKLVYRAPAIYTVHSSVISWYMPAQPWLTRLIYSNAYGVISITLRMKALIEQRHGLTNVVNLYNPVDPGYISGKAGHPAPADYPYILAIGRMNKDNVKQFDKLMEAYAASLLPSRNIKLVILGEGIEKANLEVLAEKLGLGDKVVFGGFRENPYVYMRHALFFVLSSRYEGLPMVLLESLACGTPAVAFDCFTGPSEIVSDRQNGLLVADQDFTALTHAMNLMVTDEALYKRCRANAAASIEKFSLTTIGEQWLRFLKIED